MICPKFHRGGSRAAPLYENRVGRHLQPVLVVDILHILYSLIVFCISDPQCVVIAGLSTYTVLCLVTAVANFWTSSAVLRMAFGSEATWIKVMTLAMVVAMWCFLMTVLAIFFVVTAAGWESKSPCPTDFPLYVGHVVFNTARSVALVIMWLALWGDLTRQVHLRSRLQ